MAIYSASVKTIGRSAGRSATAAAAYRTGSLVIDERQGLIHDYSRRSGVDHVLRHYPHGLADIGTDDLWNRAELAEIKCNANVARELLVALPHELSSDQRRSLADEISRALVDRYQVAAESALHFPDDEGDQRNFHAHIMFTTRIMDEEGNLRGKTRALDEKYGRGPKEVEWIREMVEVKTNTALEAAGLDVRVDRRSLKDQRAAALAAGDLDKAAELDREPTIHEGPRVTQIRREAEAEGRLPLGVVDRIAANDAIKLDVVAARAELVSLDRQIERAEALEAAHAEGLRENFLRDRITEIKAELKEKDIQRIDVKISLDRGRWPPGYVTEAKELRSARDNRRIEAQAWRTAHPIMASAADKLGLRLEVDKKSDQADKAYKTFPDLRNSISWENQRKRDFADLSHLNKEIPALVAEGKALSSELREMNQGDPSVLDKERAFDRLEHGAYGLSQDASAFVSDHRQALSLPEAPAALEGGYQGSGFEMSSDIIETGNPVIDQLSRAFRKFQIKCEREAVAYAQKLANIRPSQKSLQTAQAALELFTRIFASIDTGRNFVEPEPLTKQNLTAYTLDGLKQVRAAEKSLSQDIANAKKESTKESAQQPAPTAAREIECDTTANNQWSAAVKRDPRQLSAAEKRQEYYRRLKEDPEYSG